MSNKKSSIDPTKLRYRNKIYTPTRSLRIQGKLYLVVEEWGSRYKAFDVLAQEMRSIRVRDASVEQEMKLIQFAKIRNNSVPIVYGRWKNGKTEYLIQEWVDGFTLEHYLQQGKVGRPYFDVERSYYLIRGLATGLNRLHERSIFHGDVKPTNLIVADSNRLVLIDFGASWSGARTNLRPDEMSQNYAAPEQYSYEPLTLVDHRTDQFSASVILYEMLTGELPYGGLGGAVINYNKRFPLIHPSRKNKKVWDSLGQVLMKSLSLDKSQRYETSAAWLNDLRGAVPPYMSSHDLLATQLPGSDFFQYIKAKLSNLRFHF